jgi:hypothetical protein
MSSKKYLNVVVEDVLSEAVMRRLLEKGGYTGTSPTFVIARGNGMIRTNLDKYKGASRVMPHIVLTDLDRYPCLTALLDDWRVGALPPTMLLRIAVREVEAWLLADRKGIADFLHVAIEKVPHSPETMDDAKHSLFNVIRRSRKRRLVEEMVPQPGAHIGPLYNDRMREFALDYWQIETAAANAPSLDRSILRIAEFIAN